MMENEVNLISIQKALPSLPALNREQSSEGIETLFQS